jgi:hypothetical protein
MKELLILAKKITAPNADAFGTIVMIAFFCLELTLAIPTYAQYSWTTKKKAIEWGKDMPTARWVSDNFTEMEKTPFNGIVMVPGDSLIEIFDPKPWSNTRIDTVSLAKINWQKYTDNFILVWVSDTFGMSYANDAQWAIILNNMKVLAETAKKYKFKGFLFDNEMYQSGHSAWSPANHPEGGAISKTKALVRKRGGQVMAEWVKAFPDIKIITTYFFSYVPMPDSKGRSWEMAPDWYNGWLDSIKGNAQIIEGDEYTYYPLSTGEWFSRYDTIRNAFKMKWCKPENYAKYDTFVHVGRALYPDQIEIDGGTDLHKEKRLEHNLYAGLATTDEYVWFWDEGHAWFNSPMEARPIVEMNGPNNAVYNAFPWAMKGLTSARYKYNAGIRLGYDMYGIPFQGNIGTIDSSVVVCITAPLNNFNYSAPASFKITATVAGNTGSVEIWMNMNRMITDNAFPFEYNATHLMPGWYTFIARARVGSKWGTSNPVNVYVGTSTTDIMRLGK